MFDVSANYTGKLVEEIINTEDNQRVIKSTFNPKSVRDNLILKREVGPRTTI